MRGARALSLLAGLACPLLHAGAQSVRGTVVNESGAPVPGVIVLLVDDASNVVARTLSGGNGDFRLSTSRPGNYRTRTLRIGFRPLLSTPFPLAAAQEVVRQLVLSSVQFVLDTVKVRGRNECRVTSEAAAETFAVWEQVQTALTAAQITSDRGGLHATTITYERTLDRSGRRVLAQSTALHVNNVHRIWRARATDSLHAFGYVVREADGGSSYFAPDTETLLAPHFLEDHCFRLTTRRNSTDVGIAFEPTPSRNKLPEIRGTLWLDRATSGLKRLEFQYVNVSKEETDEARGDLEFVPARNGAWAISRWSIRMPELARIVKAQSLGSAETSVYQIKVGGGELVLLRANSDTLWARAPLQLVGTVKDSVSGAAVAGARVALGGTSLAARSGADGRFTIDGVLPGEYTLEARTPSLDSLGAVQQVSVAFTPTSGPVTVRLVPTSVLVASLCGSRAPPNPGIIVGRLVSVGDTMPFHSLQLRAEWSHFATRGTASAGAIEQRTQWIEGKADALGNFRLCGVPLNTDIVLRAESDSAERARAGGRTRNATPVKLVITPVSRIANAELRMEPARKVGADFAGVVLGDSTRAAVAGAEVIMPDLARTAVTNDRGMFRIADVPPGTHRVIVRRMGFGSMESPIEFPENRTVDRRFLLDRISLVDTVVTSANAVNESFDANRKLGLGHFLTREDLDKLNAHSLTNVLVNVPGLRLLRGTSSHAWPTSSQGAFPSTDQIYRPEGLIEVDQGMKPACYARVYVDRLLMNPGSPTPGFNVNSINPSSVQAIEYYGSPGVTPAGYRGSGSGCGVLVVWTRRSQGQK
jgi:hypothetical protein